MQRAEAEGQGVGWGGLACAARVRQGRQGSNVLCRQTYWRAVEFCLASQGRESATGRGCGATDSEQVAHGVAVAAPTIGCPAEIPFNTGSVGFTCCLASLQGGVRNLVSVLCVVAISFDGFSLSAILALWCVADTTVVVGHARRDCVIVALLVTQGRMGATRN